MSKINPHTSGNLSVNFPIRYLSNDHTFSSWCTAGAITVWCCVYLASNATACSHFLYNCLTTSSWLFTLIRFYLFLLRNKLLLCGNKHSISFPACHSGQSIESVLGSLAFDFWIPDFLIKWPQTSHLDPMNPPLHITRGNWPSESCWEIRVRSSE